MPDTFLYFAYGSNMLTRRLTAPARAPLALATGTVFAEGRRLTFDKVSTDGSGKYDRKRRSDLYNRSPPSLSQARFQQAGQKHFRRIACSIFQQFDAAEPVDLISKQP